MPEYVCFIMRLLVSSVVWRADGLAGWWASEEMTARGRQLCETSWMAGMISDG